MTSRLSFTVETQTVIRHDGPDFCWFHPRATVIPRVGEARPVSTIMTLQKHLQVSDHYSGLYTMRTDDMGASWTGPEAVPELAWQEGPDGLTVAVSDVTPGWHAKTRSCLAIGARQLHHDNGKLFRDAPGSLATAYAVYDVDAGRWTSWRTLVMPHCDTTFSLSASGSSQWLVRDDGTLLVPINFKQKSCDPYSVTVVNCAFDGTTLNYVEHGDTLQLANTRGLCEPSIAFFRGRYYLTIRNDGKAYVSVGDDGLHYAPIQSWAFDDGAELGSYNTQQHWLTHSDGLFLTYTRRGAENDHIFRHRAPLFIAQVDPENLVVIRETERILVSERGVPLGNFGVAAIDQNESWVTVGEFMWPDWQDQARERGADGSVFLARVIWSKPNNQSLKQRILRR